MDRTGPIIVASFPETDAVRVSLNVRPWVLINEYLSRNSIEGSIFVSPEPDNGFEVKVRGKRVQVSFKDKLPQDRTVVITFGSGILDVNGNQMAESFVMAFSTGDSIDRASVQGQLEKVNNAPSTWVWAYPLSLIPNPDPRTDKALYAVQPDLDGRYQLSHMPGEKYRLFAVTDARRDRLWDPNKETIAFPSEDVNAVQGDLPIVNLMLGTIDLTPPAIRGIQAIHQQGFRLSLDEPVNSANMTVTAISQDGRAVPVIDVYQSPSDSSAVLLTTGIQREGDEYQLHIQNLRDLAGNQADTLTAEVTASASIDSTGPRLTWSDPADGMTEFDPNFLIQLAFSEAVNFTDLDRSVSLIDPEKGNVAGNWKSYGSCLGVFTPEERLSNNQLYSIRVLGDSLRDVFGNVSPDSLVNISFKTWNTDDIGAVSGEIPDAPDHLQVVIEQLDGDGKSKETSVQQNGSFRFDDLPADLYSIWIYQDHNENHHYSPGNVDPFTFSEPFRSFSDTIRVRPRWETEGVILFWNQIPDTSRIDHKMTK
ncbi:MAG: Ig-like domain-containing protein [bacterium]